MSSKPHFPMFATAPTYGKDSPGQKLFTARRELVATARERDDATLKHELEQMKEAEKTNINPHDSLRRLDTHHPAYDTITMMVPEDDVEKVVRYALLLFP